MDQEKNNTSILRNFDQESNTPLFSTNVVIALILIALVGVGSGYYLAKKGGLPINLPQSTGKSLPGLNSSAGQAEGSTDYKTFSDTAEGTVQEGGLSDEGQFHLVRPGGDSQNVYMTSSIVDLSKYVGKKVKVWGQTQTAKRAGWLMDVGRVQALE